MNVPDYRIVDFSIYFCGSIDVDVIFSVTILDKRRSFEKSSAEINIFNISISSKSLLISIPSSSVVRASDFKSEGCEFDPHRGQLFLVSEFSLVAVVPVSPTGRIQMKSSMTMQLEYMVFQL